ncbi:uncharacterized protein An16g03240 [Aspergillus niger]|uniref:Contig An16c0110, genomic contig n=2 Tax=Aspergillus niger TaxID=5061 RepID=A2R7E5_ASPNC|nr:uncharacterized protein An16g03240 [Aspergillus niger]CAK42823.1 unnamed protein product [Aspergillus niger]
MEGMMVGEEERKCGVGDDDYTLLTTDYLLTHVSLINNYTVTSSDLLWNSPSVPNRATHNTPTHKTTTLTHTRSVNRPTGRPSGASENQIRSYIH